MLAAFRGVSYFAAAAVAALAGCARPPGLPAPEGAFTPVSAEAFRAFAARTAPAAPVAYYFHWRLDGSAEMSGRGAVRLSPPDSLRLDVGVPVLGRATVVLAGDSEWAKPATVEGRILPGNGPAMIWALFGVVRPPAGEASVEESGAGSRRWFRVTEAGNVVTALVFSGDTLLGAQRTRDGRTIGLLSLRRDSLGALARVEAVDREQGARFVVIVDRREGGPFPSEIWRRP